MFHKISILIGREVLVRVGFFLEPTTPNPKPWQCLACRWHEARRREGYGSSNRRHYASLVDEVPHGGLELPLLLNLHEDMKMRRAILVLLGSHHVFFDFESRQQKVHHELFWSRTLWVGEEEPKCFGRPCGLPGFHLSVTVSFIYRGIPRTPCSSKVLKIALLIFSPILR